MKKGITLIAVVAFFACWAHGQAVIRSTVGSGGTSQTVVVKEKTYYISQSIGQASVIGTSTVNGHIVCQGFQQPPFDVIIGKPLADEGLLTTIYPNPFTQTVTIAFQRGIKKNVSVILFDTSGKIVLDRNYAPSQLITLSLENIATGSYILAISSGQNKTTTPLIKQ